MSNEELVCLIQNGERHRMPELWEQVERLVRWKANRIYYTLKLCDQCKGIEFDDLYQSGYPAMVEAVETYKPDIGAFSTWFMFYLQHAFATTAGYRTKQGRAMLNASSLDRPMTDDKDSGAMIDMVPDYGAVAAIESVEECVYRDQLHEALEKALSTLPEECSQTLRLRFYEGQGIAETAQTLGVSDSSVKQFERKGLEALRLPKTAAHLIPFYDFNFYIASGLTSFQRSGMSVQEKYLVIMENREYKRKQKKWQEEQKKRERFERLYLEYKEQYLRERQKN